MRMGPMRVSYWELHSGRDDLFPSRLARPCLKEPVQKGHQEAPVDPGSPHQPLHPGSSAGDD